ncbi:MAG: AlwI family type II restriction endonuclease [Candidatus Paceibacterota bacterium]
MAKVWSFNTTVRNPERMEHMLRALTELEGVNFDSAGQERFFGLQIKKRLYKPTNRILQDADLITAVHSDDSAEDIDESTVERILAKYRSKPVNGSGRGRTTAGILNRFGLCIALQSNGPVIITEVAKKWLNHEIEDGELFSKFLLKWQYPNKIETGYNDFDIMPFVAVLSLIKLVNEKWSLLNNKSVGLSKEEYQLFVPSLSKASQIEEYANRIISYRKEKESRSGVDLKNFIKKFANDRAAEIYGQDEDIKTILNDFRDYMDSSMRYFRVSGLIVLRGGDTHIDIAKDKEVEVNSILENITPNSKEFDSYESYFNYLSNIDALELPWQNNDDLEKVSEQLSKAIKSEAGEINTSTYFSGIESLSPKKKVDRLEESLNDIRIIKLRDLKHNIEVLDECINKIQSITHKNYETLTARPSLDLEWYVSRSLMVLNDAIKILPSFNVGDDGIPTGFRSNTSDIKCNYESFGMTVEVTLLLGRDQWYAEGQPVMQHLRDFEDTLENKTVYCLFIAPFIHRGALNTFWTSNKFGYEGKTQNIIPLTITQFLDVLKIAKSKISGNNLNHESLHNLLNLISNGVVSYGISQEWINTFTSIIQRW